MINNYTSYIIINKLSEHCLQKFFSYYVWNSLVIFQVVDHDIESLL